MNDPHVAALIYRINHSDLVDYKKASPLIVESPGFRVTLDGGKARAEMLEHFATEQGARGAVEPFLREWELAADLQCPRDRLRFSYERAQVIDRSPGENEGGTIIKVVGDTIGIGIADVAHLGRGSWPEPPVDLGLSPLVEALRAQWLKYRERRDDFLLGAAAYWALTMIKAAPPAEQSQEDPSQFFNISSKVLKKVGDLSSTRGRKAGGAQLTGSERRWLEDAFKALVERAALRAHYNAPPPTPLTMKDLPDLTP